MDVKEIKRDILDSDGFLTTDAREFICDEFHIPVDENSKEIRTSVNVVVKDDKNQLVYRFSPIKKLDRMKSSISVIFEKETGFLKPNEKIALSSGFFVTVWPLCTPAKENDPRSYAELGILLSKLNKLEPTENCINSNKNSNLKDRIKKIDESAPDYIKNFLIRRAFKSEKIIEEKLSGCKNSIIHGDAHVGNIVIDRDGQYKLIDTDRLGFGVKEIDIAPNFVRCRRFHKNKSLLKAFTDNYHNEFDKDLLSDLIFVRESSELLWLSSLWSMSEENRIGLTNIVDNIDNEKFKWNALSVATGTRTESKTPVN